MRKLELRRQCRQQNDRHSVAILHRLAPVLQRSFTHCTTQFKWPGRSSCVPNNHMSQNALYFRADEPTAHGFHCCPRFCISFAWPASPYCALYVYIHLFIYLFSKLYNVSRPACARLAIIVYIYLIVYRLYMNYRCYQITLQRNTFTQIGCGAK